MKYASKIQWNNNDTYTLILDAKIIGTGGRKYPLDFEVLFFFKNNLVGLGITNDDVCVQIKLRLILGLLCHNSNLECCCWNMYRNSVLYCESKIRFLIFKSPFFIPVCQYFLHFSLLQPFFFINFLSHCCFTKTSYLETIKFEIELHLCVIRAFIIFIF